MAEAESNNTAECSATSDESSPPEDRAPAAAERTPEDEEPLAPIADPPPAATDRKKRRRAAKRKVGAGYVYTDKMSTPYFAEDSNALTMAPILANTIDKLRVDADRYDHVMAFFIAIMAEGGYRVMCLYNETTETWSTEVTTIPPRWIRENESTYEVDFLQHKRSNIGIRFIGIPMGDWMVLNMMSKEDCKSVKTRSIAINVSKYVNMHNEELGKYWNLKELAFKFKNNLLAPVHADIMMAIGLASPSLMGIPEEIKENISKMLDERSRRNLEESYSLNEH